MKTSIYRAQRAKKSEHKCEHQHGEKTIAAGMFRYFEHKSNGKNDHKKKKNEHYASGPTFTYTIRNLESSFQFLPSSGAVSIHIF